MVEKFVFINKAVHDKLQWQKSQTKYYVMGNMQEMTKIFETYYEGKKWVFKYLPS